MISLETLKERMPPKEQWYFGVVALFALYAALATPTSVPNASELRREAVAARRGDVDEARMTELLEQAQRPPGAPASATLSAARDSLMARLKALTPPPADGRDLFQRSGEKVYALPPPVFAYPGLPNLPGHDPTVGPAPETTEQYRPTPPEHGPVSLTEEEKTPFDFKDREPANK